MTQLNLTITVKAITEAESGDLVSYGDGTQYGIVFKPFGNENIGVVSLTEFKILLALDDWKEPHAAFQTVGVYGSNFNISVESGCSLVSHSSELKAGNLVLKGKDLYIVLSNANPSGGVRCVNLSCGKSQSADALGYGVGYFTEWSVVVASAPRGDATVALMRT